MSMCLYSASLVSAVATGPLTMNNNMQLLFIPVRRLKVGQESVSIHVQEVVAASACSGQQAAGSIDCGKLQVKFRIHAW